MISENDVIDCLKDARSLIEKGWIKGRLSFHYHGYSSYCSIGAIDAAGRGRRAQGVEHAAANELCHAIWRPARHGFIVLWNDAPWRSQASVLRAFDRAIKRCERRQRKMQREMQREALAYPKIRALDLRKVGVPVEYVSAVADEKDLAIAGD